MLGSLPSCYGSGDDADMDATLGLEGDAENLPSIDILCGVARLRAWMV